jgi:pyrimidine operon attenuation protein / uracil phosphoribosyltransferase
MDKRLILDHKHLGITLNRLAVQLLERHKDFAQTALIGLQPRGVEFAKKIHDIVSRLSNNPNIKFGALDSTFYRDDFRRTDKPLIPSEMQLNFSLDDMNIILLDDVLYTGRSVRSALNALNDFGRPQHTELMVLIDRKFNRELPIQPDYIGEAVDTRGNDRVIVELTEENKVWIITENKSNE